MPDSISQSFLNQSASILADTAHGLSGSKIVQYCNAWSIDHDIDIPHSLYPFEAQSKRVALVQNLSAFPARLQFGLLLELCDDWQLRTNEGVHALRERIQKKKAEYEAENDWAAPSPTAPPQPPASPHANRLRVFLCHSSADKHHVRQLHAWLLQEGFEPWLDEEDLLPGDDWEYEIKRAVRRTDIMLVCLTEKAACKIGFIQKEIKLALDCADERPDGEVFIIPARFEACTLPERLARWQCVDLTSPTGYDKLRQSLRRLNGKQPKA